LVTNNEWVGLESNERGILSMPGTGNRGQTRFVFRQIRNTLEKLGATLDDVVSTTTYITDMKYRPQFIEIRKEFFTMGYPASALIGVKELARPPMMIEVQAIAVVD
jgi:enamine deaminase RidA (YjgF/YER057c/UK114 family)